MFPIYFILIHASPITITVDTIHFVDNSKRIEYIILVKFYIKYIGVCVKISIYSEHEILLKLVPKR